MNWLDYIDYWDEFTRNWLADPLKLANSDCFISNNFSLDTINELPEPYYCGVPLDSELDAVIVNLNPGASATNEWVKYHCFRDNPMAFVVYEANKAGSYRAVNNKFNPLLTTTLDAVPGKDWWEANRWKWLDAFFPYGGRRSPNGYRSEKVLAMELFPWHSKSFNYNVISGLLSNQAKHHLMCLFVDPLSDAINRSRLVGGRTQKQYGLCFSKTVYDLLTNHFGFTMKQQWDASTVIPGGSWPVNAAGKLINRTYALIEGKDSSGNIIRLLCLWYNNIGVYAPTASFGGVEAFIKSQL